MLKNLNKSGEFPSELRFDLASKDWVVIATGRAKKPEIFKKEKRQLEETPRKFCPFCDLKKQEIPTLIFSGGRKLAFQSGAQIPDNWTTAVFPNKYPAFSPGEELNSRREGNLYERMNAVGFHEVVVTRDHDKQLAQFSIEEIKELIDAYQERYLSLKEKKFVNHISIFHNHGREAGASVAHPHSQIITTPLVDIDLDKALVNSREYLEANKNCVYCLMNEWELNVKQRVIFENEEFLAICPFASKTAFEVIISPKKHLSYFEKSTEKQKLDLAEAFKAVFYSLWRALNNPAYNFYLHTAPCDNREKYDFYHWHFTILPKTAVPAGFEIGTRMEISTIEPEKAAAYLRKQIA